MSRVSSGRECACADAWVIACAVVCRGVPWASVMPSCEGRAEPENPKIRKFGIYDLTCRGPPTRILSEDATRRLSTRLGCRLEQYGHLRIP